MQNLFRHFDSLRVFVDVARHDSFSDAAAALNMTKGAVSYQIKTLEADLGLILFHRRPRGVTLSQAGQALLDICRPRLEAIESDLARLSKTVPKTLTVGMSSYFASRWLSPRLMGFMQDHPDIQLRIQPMTRLFDLADQDVDLAIRWGHGAWDDAHITPLMPLPAWPVGNQEAADRVRDIGLEQAFAGFTLLRDHDDSNAWSDWLSVAGLPEQTRQDTLIIPDPNVRVQAVIDGQGIALNDALVAPEMQNGLLVRLSNIELASYGYYLAQPLGRPPNPNVDEFAAWIERQASG